MQVRLVSGLKLLDEASLDALGDWLRTFDNVLEERRQARATSYWMPLTKQDLLSPDDARTDLAGVLERCAHVVTTGARRISMVREVSDAEQWIIEARLTRIPHVVLSTGPGVSEPGVRPLVPGVLDSLLALGILETCVVVRPPYRRAEVSGWYVTTKAHAMSAVKRNYEMEAVPGEASLLKKLREVVRTAHSRGDRGRTLFDMPARGAEERAFIGRVDDEVVQALGTQALQDALDPLGVSVAEWLKGGRSRFKWW